MVVLNVFREHLKKFSSKCGKSSILLNKFLYCSIPFLSVFSLLCCMIVPVQAVALEPAMTTTNMKEGSVFNLYSDGNYVGTYLSSTAQYTYTRAEWSWEHFSSSFYDRVVVIIQGTKPVTLYWHQTRDIPMSYEGSFGDDYHMYSTDQYDIGESCSVIAQYASYGYRTFNLVSCVGYSSSHERITQVDFGRRAFDFSSESWNDINWTNNTTLPKFWGNDSYSEYDRGTVYVNIDPDDRDLEYAKSATFLLRVAGSNPVVSASLNDSDGNPVTVLNSVSFESLGTSSPTDRNDIIDDWILVTIDLSGYDLVGKTIQFQLDISSELGFYKVSVYDCYMVAEISNDLNFWGQLWLWLSNIDDKLSQLIGNNADTSGAESVDQGLSQIEGFESGYQDSVSSEIGEIDVAFNFQTFTNALAFVSTYTTRSFMALGDVSLLWYLPIAIGIILFICSRTPGNTFKKTTGASSSNKDNFD